MRDDAHMVYRGVSFSFCSKIKMVGTRQNQCFVQSIFILRGKRKYTLFDCPIFWLRLWAHFVFLIFIMST